MYILSLRCVVDSTLWFYLRCSFTVHTYISCLEPIPQLWNLQLKRQRCSRLERFFYKIFLFSKRSWRYKNLQRCLCKRNLLVYLYIRFGLKTSRFFGSCHILYKQSETDFTIDNYALEKFTLLRITYMQVLYCPCI
jgi:hypothetical protein